MKSTIGRLRFVIIQLLPYRTRSTQRCSQAPNVPFAASCHVRQHQHQLVDIVDDENLNLSSVLAVEATLILSERAFRPGR